MQSVSGCALDQEKEQLQPTVQGLLIVVSDLRNMDIVLCMMAIFL